MAAADISAQIRAIQQASRGEEVRDSIATALDAINDGAKGQTDIDNAINALDVNAVGGNGKYIKSISESNGKISADEETADTQPTANSQKLITSGAVANAVQTLQTNFQAGVDDIYDAVVAKGSTPASHSLSDVVDGIGAIETGIEPTGTKQITQNGVSDVTNYASVNVQVPQPSGTVQITQNGTVDVKNYEYANVNVPSGGGATGTIDITEEGVFDVANYANANVSVKNHYIPHGTTWVDSGIEYIMDGLEADYVWSDGVNTYYSYGSDQYVYDTVNNTWVRKTWNGLTDFYGEYVWTDGENIYYSYSSEQCILDKSTSTWSTKTWSGLTSFQGKNVWTDGTNIYTTGGWGAQYVLDKATSTWNSKTWTGLTSPDPRYIWTDGTNIYYSYGSTHYILDVATSTWSKKTWTGKTSFYREYIWSDGVDTYYSYGGSSDQYVLDAANSAWVRKTWNTNEQFYGKNVYEVNGSFYVNMDSSNYLIDITNATFTKVTTWFGPSTLSGNYIWSDGDNMYYSNGTKQLVLDKSINRWVDKTWYGLDEYILYEFNGSCVWSDGRNIYAVIGDGDNYILDKATSTWSEYSWGGDVYVSSANDVWNDGENIYCVSNGRTYKLSPPTTTQQDI